MKKKFVFILMISFVTFSLISQIHHTPRKGFVSWLPASKWEDALLTGNGTLGAMIMGNPFEETIILNHALLFIPNEAPVVPPNMVPFQQEIKQLSFAGKYKEVAELGVKIWKDSGYGEKKWTDPYVPAANLTIDMPASNVVKYRRMVDYQTAECMVEWTDQKGTYTRKTFASRADGVIITQIKGTIPVTADISLHKQPHSWDQNATMSELIKVSSTSIDHGLMHYHCEYGKAHSHSPDGYDALLKVITKGGELSEEGDRYIITDADEVLIFTQIEPYKGDDKKIIDNISQHLDTISTDYDSLLQRQMETHGELYNRVSLELGECNDAQQMTAETLVSSVRKTTTPGVMQRQFEAARYHILCSTGTNPPNLQGIWSGTWTPPWCSDFTHDGNVQVAISNLLNGNMTELMIAYFDYHERMMDDYRTNAKQFYGTRGIHIPSHTSSHGLNNHYDETWCMEYWNGGAGWAASYFYDYYLYTGDTIFLKERAFPFMNEALIFWEDFLTMGDDGKYIVVPSYSPENNPLEHRWQNCINATMDVMIIKELTRNWIASAKALGISPKEIKQKEAFLSHLPNYQISEDGVLREWLWDDLTDNQAHRHASHLYGLYEVPDKEILASEDLQKAVKKTINERMKIRKQQQGGEMSFGMCHLGFAAVNMKDTETAAEILAYLSRFYWTNSMATTHNPGDLFNMDISGGIPSLMTRMIVNSRPGYVHILPTLPESWSQGELKGVLARGGICFNHIQWNEQSIDISIVAKNKHNVIFDFGLDVQLSDINIKGAKYHIEDGLLSLDLKAGQKVNITLKR